MQGQEPELVRRDRPWYAPRATPTFTQILGALRLDLWRQRIFGEAGPDAPQQTSKEMLDTLLHCLAAVR